MHLDRHAVRLVVATLLVAIVSVVGVSAVWAHNTFVASTPSTGAVLAESPAQVSMTFATSVPLETASAVLIDASGVQVELLGLTHGPTGDTELIAPLPALSPGEVTVRWRLVGPDGHPLTGRVTFSITAPPTAAPTTSPASTTDTAAGPAVQPTTAAPTGFPGDDDGAGVPSVVRWLLRYASYLAIMAVLGIVLTDATVWMGSARLPTMRRAVDGALLAVAVLGLAQLVVIASDITGEAPWASLGSLRAASRTDAGLALTLRAFMAGCAWVVLRRMELRQHDVRATALGLTGLTLMGTWAFAGHAASQRWPEIGVPIDVMHHTAAAAWIGSLTIVGLVALPTVSSDQRLDIMTRLSRTAATAVVVIVVTGSVQTVRLAGSFGAMFSDTHGRILVLKTALVAVMLAVANANRQRVRRAARRPDRAGSTSIGALRRSVVVEFAIGLLVLAITSALVVSPPGAARSDTTGDPRRPSDSYTM